MLRSGDCNCVESRGILMMGVIEGGMCIGNGVVDGGE